MRNRITAIAIILVCIGAGYGIGYGIGSLLGKNRVSGGIHQITVLETTDIHGSYFSRSYDSRAVATSMSNVSSYLKELRSEGADPVLVDNGDNLQGDNAAYFYNYVAADEPHIFSRIVEYLGYDALVVGNHDVETGHPVYDRLKESSKIPYLAGNAVYDGGQNDGNPYFLPYTVIKRDGVRIAIIGMTNAGIKNWLSETIWSGMDFVQISEIAQSVVDEVIKKEKPHLVLVSVHSGTGDNSAGREDEAMYLASTLSGVDAVLCGHDHRAVAMEVPGVQGDVALVNAGAHAEYVGMCRFDLTFKRGRLVNKSHIVELVDMKQYPADSQYDAMTSDSFEKVNEFANRQIGVISEDIPFEDALTGPSAYINLIQTVQLEETGADISFTAPLSTKGKVAAGPVTFQNLVDIYRYENQLFTVKLTGRQIKDYLEYSYDAWVKGEGYSSNYDSADGIIYTVRRNAEMGSRVRIISMKDGSPFNEDAVYTVAMTSYRASGGGNLLLEGAHVNPSDLEVVERFADIRTMIGDYIDRCGSVKPEKATNWHFE